MSGAAENILRWFGGISAALRRPIGYFSRPRRSAADIATEIPTDSTAVEAGAGAAATKSAVVTPTVEAPLITDATADAKIGQEAPVSHVAPSPTDQQEIQRRRALVRALFNDFWSERDDKPVTFVDRLDQAEAFLNGRLAACGELWQLDGESRKILGLPPRSSSRDGNGAAGRI
jgi:hypothetical protein